MYKVFVNSSPIILTSRLSKETSFKLFLLETANIPKIVRQLGKKEFSAAHLYHPHEELLLKKFKKRLKVVRAGGGLVRQPGGKVLFIKRKNKWDLPKGGLKRGESPEEAALREVWEETGAAELKIKQSLGTTWHIFRRGGELKLKETYWYLMNSKYTGKLVPQKEEGIEIASWKKPAQIPKLLAGSYANIRWLFESENITEHL